MSNNEKKLTPDMQKAMDWIKLHGSIDRYEGGFWSFPNATLTNYYGDYFHPIEYVGTNTIHALERRGLIKISAERTSKYGSFPVQYKITNQP